MPSRQPQKMSTFPPSSPRVFLAPGVGALVLLAVLAGCGSWSFKGDQVRPRGPGLAAWPFAPVSMRVHPFTTVRFDPRRGALVLEARMEMLDQFGDVTKGVGDFRFELYSATERGASGDRRRLALWEAPMATLEQNRRHYDPITRTYAFDLKVLDHPPEGGPLLLVVHFADAAGRAHQAEAKLGFGGATDPPPSTPPSP